MILKPGKHLKEVKPSRYEDAGGRNDEIRATTISGTDISAILGLNPYKTPWDVVASKRRMPCAARKESDAMVIGTYLQEAVAALYSRFTGHVVLWDDVTVVSPEYPWASCTPDARLARRVKARVRERLTLDLGGGSTGILEIKTAGNARMADWGPSGSDLYPKAYGVQAAWNCIVTGAKFCDIAVLLGAQSLDVRWYRVEPSEELKQHLLSKGKEFWDKYVAPDVTETMPPIEDSAPARAYLNSLEDTGDWREPTDDEIALAHEYDAASQELDKAEKAKADAKARLQLSIGDKTGLIWGKGNKVSNKSQVRSNGETIRVLRVKLVD